MHMIQHFFGWLKIKLLWKNLLLLLLIMVSGCNKKAHRYLGEQTEQDEKYMIYEQIPDYGKLHHIPKNDLERGGKKNQHISSN